MPKMTCHCRSPPRRAREGATKVQKRKCERLKMSVSQSYFYNIHDKILHVTCRFVEFSCRAVVAAAGQRERGL